MTYIQTIRFHQIGTPDVLVMDQLPRPVPGPREALLRVEAAGINFADVVRRRGDPYPIATPLPFSPGGECVGIVEELGAEMPAELLGRRMFAFPGMGCYASHALAPLERLFDVPAGLDPASATALFVQGLSAALILRSAGRLAKGETVLVQGAAGGVGLIAVQLARLAGAGLVIALAGSEDKLAIARAHGADHAVNYTAADWVDTVRTLTGGRGVDLVLEMTGGTIAEESLTLLAPFGRCVVYGSASNQPLLVHADDLPGRNLSVTGFYLRGYLGQRAMLQQLLDELGEHIRQQRLRIHIGGSFALRDAPLAHRAMETRATTGKLVLLP
jgi:NADPH:quinone reductase